MSIELITSITNSNLKIRKLAEESFDVIQDVMGQYKSSGSILQMLLVGLVGSSPQMQSSTIRSLIYNMKAIIVIKRQALEESHSKLLSTEPQV